MAAPPEDVTAEGRSQPRVTGAPEDPPGHVPKATGDATTALAPVTVSPGGDDVTVAAPNDVTVEGRSQPSVTEAPGATTGHVVEAPRDATAMVGPYSPSPAGDGVIMAHGDDVTMEGTESPGATSYSGDPLGHVPEAPRDATTAVGPVTVSPGGNDVMVATPGDIAMEGTAPPGATAAPGANVGHIVEATRDATTVVAPNSMSQAGDDVIVATPGDVPVEGTESPGTTNCSTDPLGHVPEVPRGATTPISCPDGAHLVVAPGDNVTTRWPGVTAATQGGDQDVVARAGGTLGEATGRPDATDRPVATTGGVTEATRDATTVAGPVATSPGGAELAVASGDDVITEAAEWPRATDCAGATEGPGGDTATVGPITAAWGGCGDTVVAPSDVIGGGTEEPSSSGAPGATTGHNSGATRDATTAVAPGTMTQGGDDIMVATPGDVIMEGRDQPSVTVAPGATSGHVPEAPRDATTIVAPVISSQEGDVIVATAGDIIMEGRDQPSVTIAPGATSGHVTEAPRDATTVVGLDSVPQEGDDVMAATPGDVTKEVTAQPCVTEAPGAMLGHVPEAPRDATTIVAPVTSSQEGDVIVATAGDVIMEGRDQPSVTKDPRATPDRVTEAPRDATTMVGAQGGDDVMAATLDDVIMEGRSQPSVTKAPQDATTAVGPIAVSQGGDDIMVATFDDVIKEAAAQPSVTRAPGATLGHIPKAPQDATATVAPVTASPGGDDFVVATPGDVITEGKEQPDVTGTPGAALGHVTAAPQDATVGVAPVTLFQGGADGIVATPGDVSVEGRDQPAGTEAPGAALGHASEATRDATTMVAPVTVPQGDDDIMVATPSDIIMEGRDQASVTGAPGATLGRAPEATRDATTMVAPVTSSQGGNDVMVATLDDVTVEVTAQPSVTGGPAATLGPVVETPRDATTAVTPVTVPQDDDDIIMATQNDITAEVTAQPSATAAPGATLGRVTKALPDATTVVGSSSAAPASDDVIAAKSDDVTMEGTESRGATNCSRDPLGHIPEAPRDATSAVAPVTVSAGGDDVTAAAFDDVITEETAQLGVTGAPRATTGHVPNATRGATTMAAPVTSSLGGHDVMAAPPPLCHHAPPPPAAAFPVTLAPAGGSPSPTTPLPLPLLLLLPLPLLLR